MHSGLQICNFSAIVARNTAERTGLYFLIRNTLYHHTLRLSLGFVNAFRLVLFYCRTASLSICFPFRIVHIAGFRLIHIRKCINWALLSLELGLIATWAVVHRRCRFGCVLAYACRGNFRNSWTRRSILDTEVHLPKCRSRCISRSSNQGHGSKKAKARELSDFDLKNNLVNKCFRWPPFVLFVTFGLG